MGWKLVEADPVPKGRNHQEPGTEVPGRHNQRIESATTPRRNVVPEGTAQNHIRPHKARPRSNPPNKITLQSRPIANSDNHQINPSLTGMNLETWFLNRL